MVDPNRKINRLTEKDIEFLEECEQEFGLRYTEEDTEFMEHCAKPLADPPIVDNWSFGGGDDSRRNDGAGRSHHRGGGNRHRGNWQDSRGGGGRGDGGNYNRNYRHRKVGGGGGYGLGYGGGGGSGAPIRPGADKDNGFKGKDMHRERYRNRERGSSHYSHNRPPMNVRRDYNNFVAASKDE